MSTLGHKDFNTLEKRLDSETMVSVHAVPNSTQAKTAILFGKLSRAERLSFLEMQWLPQDKFDVRKQTLLRVNQNNLISNGLQCVLQVNILHDFSSLLKKQIFPSSNDTG